MAADTITARVAAWGRRQASWSESANGRRRRPAGPNQPYRSRGRHPKPCRSRRWARGEQAACLTDQIVDADGPILVTGAAGFIGHAVCARLLDRGESVIGGDNFNAYYDPALKEARVATLAGRPGFRMVRMDIAEAEPLAALVRDSGTRRVVHLA